MTNAERKKVMPVWEKAILTMEEATAYTGIGSRKLRHMTNDPSCEFVIWVGKKKMFKRKAFDTYLENAYSA